SEREPAPGSRLPVVATKDGGAIVSPRLPVLSAPQTKGHASVVKLTNHWFVVAQSHELRGEPIARTLNGVPLVLFRENGTKAAALLDRCPHRNVPLSAGEIVSGQLQCAYHGWRFDAEGACR